MTEEERKNPDIFNVSRKNRVAKGSGTTIQEVNKLLKQFSEMRKMIKEMSNMGLFGGGFGKKGKQLKKMIKTLESQMKTGGESLYSDMLNPEKFLGKMPKFPFKK